MSRAPAKAMPIPMTAPTATSFNPPPVSMRTTSPGSAPRAMRIPTSRVRVATA